MNHKKSISSDRSWFKPWQWLQAKLLTSSDITPKPTFVPWQQCFSVTEVDDAEPLASELFRKSFGHPLPTFPRHFVMTYRASPSADVLSTNSRVVAYIHHTPHLDTFLCGGMCVDPGIYRELPRDIFLQVRDEGGLATIIARESIKLLGSDTVVFGHVGDKRARQSDLRAGFVDTEFPFLMAVWNRDLSGEEKRALATQINALGPF